MYVQMHVCTMCMHLCHIRSTGRYLFYAAQQESTDGAFVRHTHTLLSLSLSLSLSLPPPLSLPLFICVALSLSHTHTCLSVGEARRGTAAVVAATVDNIAAVLTLDNAAQRLPRTTTDPFLERERERERERESALSF